MTQRTIPVTVEPSWGMFPKWVAVLASYVWLGLVVWTLATNGDVPNLVKALCIGCWGAVGIWVWERTDQINDDHGAAGLLLFRFAFSLFWGPLAVCIAAPLAGLRRLR